MTTIDDLNQLLENEWPAMIRMKKFPAAVDLIIRGWEERRGNGDLPPWECDKGFLRRGAYRLISHCLDNGHSAVIHALVAGDRRLSQQSPSFEDNPFYWGLLAMFADASVIDKDQRRLIGHQLLYAYRHQVPEHFLIGFLLQIGRSEEIYAKVRQKRREPWPRRVRKERRLQQQEASELGASSGARRADGTGWPG